MKTISAHSPRSFLSAIFGFRLFRFFVYPPQNEKGGIRGKTRERRLIYLLDNHSTIEGKKILRKKRERFPKWEGRDETVLRLHLRVTIVMAYDAYLPLGVSLVNCAH